MIINNLDRFFGRLITTPVFHFIYFILSAWRCYGIMHCKSTFVYVVVEVKVVVVIVVAGGVVVVVAEVVVQVEVEVVEVEIVEVEVVEVEIVEIELVEVERVVEVAAAVLEVEEEVYQVNFSFI